MSVSFARLRGAPKEPRSGRRWVAGLGAVALAVGITVVGAPAASAASASVTDATFTWGLSNEQGGGAFFGGCNFLSAGTAGNSGSSRLWTAADTDLFKVADGNTSIRKLAPTNDGSYEAITFSNKCIGPNGAAVSSSSTASTTGVQAVITGGTGTVDPDAGTASITWTGSFTSVFYGGLTYWSASNPVLTVNSDGTGTVTATASGYGASMDDPGLWVALSSRTITLANLTGVQVTATGFSLTPDYLGVSVNVPAGATAQPAQTPGNSAYWGSFPQSFVDFQQETGQSSYWYTSGGSRDPAKPATALSIAYTAGGSSEAAPVVTTHPASTSVQVGGVAIFTAAASGTPAPTVQWEMNTGSGWVNVLGASTSTTLQVTAQSLAYNGSQVRAVFTNSVGTATSDPATLTVTGEPDPGPGDNQQTIIATIPEPGPGGEFSWTIDATDRTVTLSEAQNQGSYLQSTGDLKPVKVTDTRTGGPAWSVSGQLSDFSGGLSGKYLGWTPTVVAEGAGATAGAAVASGIDSGNGLTDSSVLGSAVAGHAGGTGTLGAALDLRVPVDTPAGTYTATLTLTALS